MARKKQAEAPLPGTIIGEANGLPIRRLKVGEISPADYNPREITERALEALGNSVKLFGLTVPLVWNKRTQRLVGGHQRLKTLDPHSETDVIEVNLDEDRERALNLALNNPASQGDFTADVGSLLDSIETSAPEIFASLALDDLRIEVPNLGVDELNPDDIPDVDETVTKVTTCPSCGHVF